MFALVNLTFIRNPARISDISQKTVNIVLVPRPAAEHSIVSGEPAFTHQSPSIHLAEGFNQGFFFPVNRVNPPNHLSFFWINHQPTGGTFDVVTENRGTTHPFSLPAGSAHFVLGAFRDDFTFKLGE